MSIRSPAQVAPEPDVKTAAEDKNDVPESDVKTAAEDKNDVPESGVKTAVEVKNDAPESDVKTATEANGGAPESGVITATELGAEQKANPSESQGSSAVSVRNLTVNLKYQNVTDRC